MPPLRILVTGANGFIGRSLLKKLKSPQRQLYALDQEFSEHARSLAIKEFYAQDISQPFSLKESFDFVFHLAALNVTHVGKAAWGDYHKVNVQGTQNVIEAVKAKNFVFMSTAKVYDDKLDSADESSRIDPRGDYEKSKWKAENICEKLFREGNLTIFRPVNITGAGQAEKALLPVFFKNAYSHSPLEIFAPRGSKLQLLDVDDIVRAFTLLIEHGGAAGIFNLAPEEDIVIDTLAAVIVRLSASRSPIQFTNNTPPHFCRIIAQKAAKTFGWKAQISPENILNRYVKQRQNS